MSNWEYVKNFYVQHLHFPPRVVDYIAVDQILKYCVEGISVKSIAGYTESDEEYIAQVLVEFLEFLGWSEDLDVNPLAIYERLNGDYKEFRTEIELLTPLMPSVKINKSYGLVRKYLRIRKEVDKYYGD
jgi:hypothetical protein